MSDPRNNPNLLIANKRKNIFKEDLMRMRTYEFISEEDYQKMNSAHDLFCNKVEEFIMKKQKDDMRKQIAEKHRLLETPKPKKVLSPQEIRDRNITSILIVGVILVLLSGIILSTSNWAIMSNSTKTIMITIVAGVFFGTSYIADKYLKIHETAFAFWVLGSLFLPVAVLSAGYFQLFGSYLSIFGEGRYLLGAIGATLCIPVYIYSANKYKYRFFIWLVFVAFSLDICFIIAATHVKIDIFYFGLVVYNSMLLLAHRRLSKLEKYQMFTNELDRFIQVNLTVTTLFMLIFYSNKALNGFNLILTALMYISLVFARNGKSKYSYVFTALLVYGLYQLVENTGLVYFNALIYALVGFVFIGLSQNAREEHLKEIFNNLSGIISAGYFIFITLRPAFIQDENSVIMLLAYLLIACNYIYLAGKSGDRVFRYLAPIFIIASGFQSHKVLKSINMNIQSEIYMFSFAILMFILLYYKNKWKVLESIKTSSGLASILLMMWSIRESFSSSNSLIPPILLMVFTGVLYLIFKMSTAKNLKTLLKYIIPISFYIGLVAFYNTIFKLFFNESYNAYEIFYNKSFHAWVSIIILFMVGMLIKRYEREIESGIFIVSHALMPLVVFVASILKNDCPIIYLIPSLIYVYSIKRFISEEEWKIKLFLYMSFMGMTASIYSIFNYFDLGIISRYYVLPVAAMIILLIWFWTKDVWKRRVALFLIPFTLYGILGLNSADKFVINYDAIYFLTDVLLISTVLYLNHKEKFRSINIIPLYLFLDMLGIINDTKLTYIILLSATAIGLSLIGNKTSDKLYGIDEEEKGFDTIGAVFIDWYTVFAVIMVCTAFSSSLQTTNITLRLTPGLILVCLLFTQIKRVKEGVASRIVKTVTLLSTLIPYYTLIDYVKHPDIIHVDLIVFPYVVFCIILSKKVWIEKKESMRILEYIVLCGVSLILFQETLIYSRIGDALILGIAALAAVILGTQYRKKSFFFIGIVTLLLNVFIWTREFWRRLPWWAYLLLAGLILIGYASYNELLKNGMIKKSKITKEEIRSRFKDWE
jgi:hypothetical protein